MQGTSSTSDFTRRGAENDRFYQVGCTVRFIGNFTAWVDDRAHTVYSIEVTNPDASIVSIEKRYRQIRDLHDELLPHHGRALPTIPGKRIFGRFNPWYIARRQRRLEEYLQRVLRLESANATKKILDSFFARKHCDMVSHAAAFRLRHTDCEQAVTSDIKLATATTSEPDDFDNLKRLSGLSSQQFQRLRELLEVNFSAHVHTAAALLRFAWEIGTEGHEGQLHGTMLVFDPDGVAVDLLISTAKLATPHHSEGRPLNIHEDNRQLRNLSLADGASVFDAEGNLTHCWQRVSPPPAPSGSDDVGGTKHTSGRDLTVCCPRTLVACVSDTGGKVSVFVDGQMIRSAALYKGSDKSISDNLAIKELRAHLAYEKIYPTSMYGDLHKWLQMLAELVDLDCLPKSTDVENRRTVLISALADLPRLHDGAEEELRKLGARSQPPSSAFCAKSHFLAQCEVCSTAVPTSCSSPSRLSGHSSPALSASRSCQLQATTILLVSHRPDSECLELQADIRKWSGLDVGLLTGSGFEALPKNLLQTKPAILHVEGPLKWEDPYPIDPQEIPLGQLLDRLSRYINPNTAPRWGCILNDEHALPPNAADICKAKGLRTVIGWAKPVDVSLRKTFVRKFYSHLSENVQMFQNQLQAAYDATVERMEGGRHLRYVSQFKQDAQQHREKVNEQRIQVALFFRPHVSEQSQLRILEIEQQLRERFLASLSIDNRRCNRYLEGRLEFDIEDKRVWAWIKQNATSYDFDELNKSLEDLLKDLLPDHLQHLVGSLELIGLGSIVMRMPAQAIVEASKALKQSSKRLLRMPSSWGLGPLAIENISYGRRIWWEIDVEMSNQSDEQLLKQLVAQSEDIDRLGCLSQATISESRQHQYSPSQQGLPEEGAGPISLHESRQQQYSPSQQGLPEEGAGPISLEDDVYIDTVSDEMDSQSQGARFPWRLVTGLSVAESCGKSQSASAGHLMITNLDTGERRRLGDGALSPSFIGKNIRPQELKGSTFHPWDSWWSEKRSQDEKIWRAAETGCMSALSDALMSPLEGGVVADVNSRSLHGRTALHIAASVGVPECIEALLNVSAHVDQRTDAGLTPLHVATQRGHTEVARLLIDYNADVCSETDDGNIPLHIAAARGHAGMVIMLLECECGTVWTVSQLLVQNRLRQRPVDVARDIEVVQIFQRFEDTKRKQLNKDSYAGRTPFNTGNVLLRNARSDVVRELLNRQIRNSTESPCTDLAASLVSTSDGGSPVGGSTPPSSGHSSNSTLSKRFVRLRSDGSGIEQVGPDSFFVVKPLGRGSFSEVFQVRHKRNEAEHAMKILQKSKMARANLLRYAMTERNVLSYIRHPYIVALHYAFQTESHLVLVLQLCPGGNLQQRITCEKKINELTARLYSAEILLALEHLHDRSIVFRDLKPENCVLDVQGHCLLTDFGLSKEGVAGLRGTKSFCGSLAFLAPEILQQRGHGHTVDIYGLGVLSFAMLTGMPPFYHRDRETLFANIRHAELRVPRYVSRQAAALIHALMKREPSLRLGASNTAEIQNHEYYFGLDFQALYRREVPLPQPTSNWNLPVPDKTQSQATVKTPFDIPATRGPKAAWRAIVGSQQSSGGEGTDGQAVAGWEFSDALPYLRKD